ncbi:hypothetical protein FRC20_006160 [Serendipita sp. 405]|nr:hypothetical protein FRC20_006160 [Serendipita sp. 405]
MPRYEPEFNQFIVPEDPYAVSVFPVNKPRRSSTDSVLPPPLQKKPSMTRVRSSSVSALERLAVFAEATQRVKRRIRNFIGGAMGASLSTGNARNKRKSQDAMNVDNEWNGWCNPPGYHYYDSYPVGPEPEQEYYATSRHAFEEPRTIFPPAINRYSPKSRRGSVNSDATIACSPRRAAIIAGKRNSSKTSLPTVDQIHEIVSTAALRAQIDALPLENQDDNRQASNWPDDQIPSRLILPDRSTLTSLAFRTPYVSR